MGTVPLASTWGCATRPCACIDPCRSAGTSSVATARAARSGMRSTGFRTAGRCSGRSGRRGESAAGPRPGSSRSALWRLGLPMCSRKPAGVSSRGWSTPERRSRTRPRSSCAGLSATGSASPLRCVTTVRSCGRTYSPSSGGSGSRTSRPILGRSRPRHGIAKAIERIAAHVTGCTDSGMSLSYVSGDSTYPVSPAPTAGGRVIEGDSHDR